MGLQPRRAAGPCPPAGRCAALPGARTAAAWARSEEPEGAPGRTASLPPILPASAASPVAARVQPKKPAAAAAPKKAAPRPAEEKGARKARGAPPERAGPLSSSWPCASLQRQPPRRPPAERGARPQPAPPQPRGRPEAPAAGSRSCESLGGAAGETALRFSLSLPPEAVRLLQRRGLERQRGQPGPAGRAAPARRGARAGGGDWRALLKISLLNDRHRYDDEEYEEEEEAAAAAVDEGLVRKCTEWLRGVESAAGRDRPDRLETLPHLGTL
ncbi:proline-rich protein 18 [Rhynochetos jubatus]